MNIGYLAQLSPDIRTPPYDGPANHIRHVIQEWQSMGHQVHFIGGMEANYWHSSDLNNFLIIKNHQKNVVEKAVRKVQSLTHLPYLNYFESRRFASMVLDNISEMDCLYERTSWMSYGGWMAANKKGVPLILEYNGDPLHDLKSKGQLPAGLQLTISKSLFRYNLEHAKLLIASGQGWKNNLINKWHIPPEKISVVENGTILINLLRREDLTNFQPNKLDSEVRIAYLGSFYPWHGTKIAINAFHELLKQGVKACLIMIGAGSDLEENKRYVDHLGLQDKVIFTGALPPEEYAKILANCEIGLSPYCGWIEYSGLKLFDYKAAGLAIIASGENGQPETIIHNKTGLIIPPCDEKALFEAMKFLAQNREFTSRLGQQARLEAESKHSWKHTAEKIISVINQVVEDKNRSTD